LLVHRTNMYASAFGSQVPKTGTTSSIAQLLMVSRFLGFVTPPWTISSSLIISISRIMSSIPPGIGTWPFRCSRWLVSLVRAQYAFPEQAAGWDKQGHVIVPRIEDRIICGDRFKMGSHFGRVASYRIKNNKIETRLRRRLRRHGTRTWNGEHQAPVTECWAPGKHPGQRPWSKNTARNTPTCPRVRRDGRLRIGFRKTPA